MKFEVNISKNNIFVLIATIVILSGIFLVHAYINPATGVGHSADEIESIPWNKITNKPAGFADDIDNEGGTDCTGSKINVGGSCKTLPICASDQALRYDGTSFQCVGGAAVGLKWNKICDTQTISSGARCNTFNCRGTLYHTIYRYSENFYLCQGTTFKLIEEISCTEGALCSIEGQYCLRNAPSSGWYISGPCCGLNGPSLISGSGGELLKCS